MLKKFGTTQLASSSFISAFVKKGKVSFNGFDFYSLCDSQYGAVIESDNLHDLNNIILTEFESSQGDGGGIIQKRFGLKTINLNIKLLKKTNADLVTLIDEMKEKLQPIESELEVLMNNGQYRAYTATVSGVSFPNMNRGTNYLGNVQVSFRITSGTWKVIEPNSYFFPNITSNSSFNITVEGTRTTYPRFLFINKSTGNTATQLTARIRKLGDNSGNSVVVTRAIGNDETIELDYEKATVTVDGTEVRFDNIMTKLFTGINVIDIEFDGGINTDFYVFYNPTYY